MDIPIKSSEELSIKLVDRHKENMMRERLLLLAVEEVRQPTVSVIHLLLNRNYQCVFHCDTPHHRYLHHQKDVPDYR